MNIKAKLVAASCVTGLGLGLSGATAPAYATGSEGSTGNCIPALKTIYQNGNVLALGPYSNWVVVGATVPICSWVIGSAGGDALSSAICSESRNSGWWGDRARWTVRWVTHGQYEVC